MYGKAFAGLKLYTLPYRPAKNRSTVTPVPRQERKRTTSLKNPGGVT